MPFPLLIALQFLTRLPVNLRRQPADADSGASIIYYPLVGLLIGLLMLLLAYLTRDGEPFLQATLILALWAGITGGLHIDGLADVADAWIGGQGDRLRTLQLMKDPTCGPIAVSVVVLLLLIKLAALQTLLQRGEWTLLLLVPMLGRTSLVAAFLFIPYVRPGGLGAVLAESLPVNRARLLLLAVALSSLLIWGALGGGLVIVAGLLFLLWRRVLMRRIGGLTGDAAGALCELTEAVVMVVAALAS
ncbi:MAG: adenosylcobinamide-GDP ribazoletransferase [Sedimenticola sp.]|nr:adenosylcobinamide-GDP ribazoletransferase [Sedimenticola sp.]